jgi:hypothetical protein
VVLALGGSLLLTGCNRTADGGTGDTAVHPGLTAAGTWPLTGLPAGGTTPRHPVMVVKIDNSVSSQPQIGLGAADLVTEELVEGGSTRLAVFYYQRVPRLVGPVRSMRATDIGIVKPAKAVLVASGGAPPTVARIKAAGITAYTEGATGYRRDNARRAPYNLFMGLRQLAGTVKARATVSSYLPFGKAADLPRGKPARGLAATFSGTQTTRWTYQGGRYVNANSFAEQGDRFRPDNVLVLRVQVGDAGYLDPAGNHVPETHFTGWCGERGARRSTRPSRCARPRVGSPCRWGTPGSSSCRRTAAGSTSPADVFGGWGLEPERDAGLGEVPQAQEDVGDHGLDLGAGPAGIVRGRHRDPGGRQGAEEHPAEGLDQAGAQVVVGEHR